MSSESDDDKIDWGVWGDPRQWPVYEQDGLWFLPSQSQDPDVDEVDPDDFDPGWMDHVERNEYACMTREDHEKILRSIDDRIVAQVYRILFM